MTEPINNDLRYATTIVYDLLKELIRLYGVKDRVKDIETRIETNTVILEFYCRTNNFRSIHKDKIQLDLEPWIRLFNLLVIPQMIREYYSREITIILLREEFFLKYAEEKWVIK